MAVTAVAAGDRRNGTVAAVAAVPERGVLQRGRARTSRRGRRWRREGKRRGQWRGLRRLAWRRRRRQRKRRRRRATRWRATRPLRCVALTPAHVGRWRVRVVARRRFGPTSSSAGPAAATSTVAADGAADELVRPTSGRAGRVRRWGMSGSVQWGQGERRRGHGASVRRADRRTTGGIDAVRGQGCYAHARAGAGCDARTFRLVLGLLALGDSTRMK